MDAAFTRLKGLFTIIPVLIHLDPSQQFVVEVDASDSGVGAVLSQQRGPKNHLHSFLLFSHNICHRRRGIMTLATGSSWQ